ncbi:MAG: hypothetical protein FWE16_05580 [Firmicutes bacterium]|nr:hypothetical protein [Bacillota bacterium]
MEIFAPTIVALFIALVTVMAVVISMNKDTMWGITIKDWRKLSRRMLTFQVYLFSALVISLLLIVIMVGYIYHNSFCESIPTCALIIYWSVASGLTLILLLLSILFIRKELPLLLGEEKAFERIYRNHLLFRDKVEAKSIKKKQKKKTSENEDKLYINVDKVTALLLFTKGIGKTLQVQTGRKSTTEIKARRLNELFELQNNELRKISERSSKLIDSDFTEIYDYAFDNIKWALSFHDEWNIVKLLGEDSYYQLTRTLFAVSRIDKDLIKNLRDDFKKIFSICLTSLLRNMEEDSGEVNFSNKMFLSCLSYAINEEKHKIFFDAIVDVLSESMWLLSTEKENSQVFIMATTFYLYYLMTTWGHATDYTKANIATFLNTEMNGSLLRINWTSKFKNVIEIGTIRHSYSPVPLEKILEYVEFFERLLFRSGVSHVDSMFSHTNIIDWYLETYALYLWDIKFIDTIVGDNQKLKDDVANTIHSRWYGHRETRTSGKQIMQGHDSSWLKEEMKFREFFDLCDVSNFKESTIKAFSEFKNEVNSTVAVEVLEQTNPVTDEELDKWTKQLLDAIKIIMVDKEGNPRFGYDDKLPLSGDWRQMATLVNIPLERKGIHVHGDMFELNIRSFKDSIIFTIQDILKKKIGTPTTITPASPWLKKTAKYSRGDHLYYESTKDLNLEKIESHFLPHKMNLVWTDGAISYNVEVNEEVTRTYRLNDEEISNIIQRDYTREDGRLVYNYGGVQIFLNREQLYDIIKKTHYVIRAVFRYDAKGDKSKIKIINYKDKLS